MKIVTFTADDCLFSSFEEFFFKRRAQIMLIRLCSIVKPRPRKILDTNELQLKGQCCQKECSKMRAPVCDGARTHTNMCVFKSAQCEAEKRGEILQLAYTGQCCAIQRPCLKTGTIFFAKKISSRGGTQTKITVTVNCLLYCHSTFYLGPTSVCKMAE